MKSSSGEAAPYPNDSRQFSFEVLLSLAVLLSGSVVVWQVMDANRNMAVLTLAGLSLTVFIVALIRLVTNTDSVRAQQTSDMLKLSRQTLAILNSGLDEKAAKRLCSLLMPATTATGVVVTGRDGVLGAAGFYQLVPESNRSGYFKLSENPGIREDLCVKAAQLTMEDGETHLLLSPRDLDYSRNPVQVRACIVVPLFEGQKRIVGTLQFCYKTPRRISETQVSIAEGFGALLSTQLAANALEAQTKLATDMRLKALQNQINPHFLFNTINTIASLIRTDPMKARNLLREFAVFYRQTLQDSDDLILLSREAEQTSRYFMFEVARFGEERVELILDEDEGVEDMMVPPFLIQPLVENAVRHGMPAEGRLTVRIAATVEEGNLVIRVIDNGVGMSEEACANIMHPESSTGMGIAVKNVHDRIKGYFGPESQMIVESKLGEGTTVTLVLVRRPEEDEE